jgi:hypothetical protein
MAYIVPSRPETLEDRALYTRSRLAEVACQECGAQVKVRKNSDHHTSIQWTRDAVEDCTFFTDLAGQDDRRPIHSACPRLAASIEDAVREGVVTIGAGVDP